MSDPKTLEEHAEAAAIQAGRLAGHCHAETPCDACACLVAYQAERAARERAERARELARNELSRVAGGVHHSHISTVLEVEEEARAKAESALAEERASREALARICLKVHEFECWDVHEDGLDCSRSTCRSEVTPHPHLNQEACEACRHIFAKPAFAGLLGGGNHYVL